MSRFDDLRKAAGITPAAPSSSSKPQLKSVNLSTRSVVPASELPSQPLVSDLSLQRPVRPTRIETTSQQRVNGPLEMDEPTELDVEAKARQLPVLGQLLKGLDYVADKTEPVAKIMRDLYIPGAGLTNLAGLTSAAEAGVAKVLPKLGNSVLGRIGQKVASEAIVGAPLGAAQTQMVNPDATVDELAKGAAWGAGGGAVLGAAGKGISELRKLSAARRPLSSADDVLRSVQESNTHTINENDALLRSSPEPSMNTTPDVAPESQAMKGSWFTRLFGDQQNLGFSPFGSRRSNRIVTTDQQIVNNPLKSTTKGFVENAKQTGRTAYQNTIDYLSPLKKISREAYDSAMDASRANNIANTIVRDKFVDLEGNVVGKSLNEVMANSRGLGKKVDDYLVLRHAVDRMKRGERVYDDALQMTPEKAEEAVKKLEQRYPQLKGIGQEWNAYNENILKMGVKEGLITQEAMDTMRSANPNYAAMKRQFTTTEKLSRGKSGNAGFSGQNAPIKEVSPTGSTRRIVSPIRSAVEQTYAWQNAMLRNRTMQEVVKTVQLDPEGMKGLVEIVKKPSTSYQSLDDALREGGSEEFLNQLDNDFKNLFKHAKPGEENIVRAMVNGKPVYIKVNDPEAVKALLGMGSDQSGIILAAAQKLSNATKRSATGLFAPMFAIKSLTADTVQAAIQSPNAIKHVAVDLPHALISSIGEIMKIPGLKNLAEDFKRSGGAYSALLQGDRAVNNSVRGLRREAPFSPGGVVKGVEMAVKSPFKALEKVADASENANRMAAFRRALVNKERTPENVRNAINAARESTTNFSRKGAYAKEVEAFSPYSNAAAQGIYRLAKTVAKHPWKTLAGVGTLVVVPKLYEYAKFNDDPDYQKLPARERYRNAIISKNPDGTFNKVPMPPEYEAIGAFMTDVLNDVIKNDPEAYKGSLDALANAYTPPLVSGAMQGLTQGGGIEKSIWGTANSTVISPIAAVGANQSFTGAPIVPMRLQDNSPEFQYDEKTSEAAKWVGGKLGMAPLKVDYLLRSYGGDPARLLLPLNSEFGGGTPKNTLLKNFIVDPEFTNTLSNDFYAAKDSFTKAKNDNKDFDKALPSWYSEDLEKLLNSQAKGSVNKKLSELNDAKRTVTGNKTLNASGKANQLRDIQKQINELYLDVNSQLQKSGVPFPNR